MIYDTDSFLRVEAMIRKHAPVLMRVGDPLRAEQPLNRLVGAWRPKIHGKTVAKMRRLRAEGMTIGNIARDVGVTYRTTQRYLSNKANEPTTGS